jgi:uncharacterized protein
MLIGILSDSHGRTDAARQAAKAFAQAHVSAVVHCGDIGGGAVVHELAGDAPMYFALGNTDHDLHAIEEAARYYGATVGAEFVEVPLGDGRFLAATHGNMAHVLDALIVGGRYAYICVGHSHQMRDERVGQSRIINPGALERAARHTVALLDTDTDRLEIITIARNGHDGHGEASAGGRLF